MKKLDWREIYHQLRGYKVYCDGNKHYIYVRCMDTWVKSEEIDCLCARKEKICQTKN
jgi:hypothetical protein